MRQYPITCLLGMCALVTFYMACAPIPKSEGELPENTPRDFPLAVGNAWIYQRTRYAGFNTQDTMTATSSVTETVVKVTADEPYLIAKIQRQISAEHMISEDTSTLTLKNAPSSYTYWLVIEGYHIYSLGHQPALALLEKTGDLTLRFPLSVGEQWYLNQPMAEQHPDFAADSMLRKVQQKETIHVPAGDFEDCYSMQEIIGGSIFERWFCPGTGWVDVQSNHSGTPYGWREVLLEYNLN